MDSATQISTPITLDARARELLRGHLSSDPSARYIRVHAGRG
jgi:hypothetical protein